ncbi:MAG TPA: TonB-dependent receptor [Novosphingobium sp.]|nr:TonB-dependent receptor [Novosphingobium sp.]
MAKFFGMSARACLTQAAGVGALALAMATPAMAEDQPAQTATGSAPGAASDDTTTKEIVVTAQFRAQKLQDTPLSITAVSSALLAQRNQSDLSQIAAQAPNVQLTPMGGAFGSSMAAYIRGIGQYDFNPAYEPGVGMYVDDVYFATLTGAIMDLLDLDRVEVLRGPQGTLTGRNSIGGAIKLFSKKPSDEDSGSVEMAYGSRNRIDLRSSANFKLTDGLYVRLAGVYKRQDGYVDQVDYGCANPNNALGIKASPSTGANCVMGKLGEKNYAGMRGTIRYNPNDKIDWLVSADYSYENHTNAAGVVIADDTSKTNGTNFNCGRYCTYANYYVPAGGQVSQGYYTSNRTMFSGWGVSSNLSYNISPQLKLQSITAYRKYHETFGTDDDYTPDPNITGGGSNDLQFHFFSQELRLSGKVGNLADWTVGGYFSSQKTVYWTRQDIRYIDYQYCGGAGACDVQFTGNDPVNANTKAVFGTTTIHLSDRLNLTGGLRYTHEHKDYTFSRKNFDGSNLDPTSYTYSLIGALDGLTSVYNGSHLDWRISADYRWSPQVMTYATISTGFKGGGVSPRPYSAGQALNGTFGPETLTAYELGMKSDLFDRRLRVNLSAFYNDYKNIQLPLSDCSALDGGAGAVCSATQNAGDGYMYGLEAEISATPVHGLDIDASASWIDGRWSRVAASVGSSYKIGDPITSPNWRASAGIQYKAELGQSGSITPRFDLSYTGKQSLGRLTATSDVDYNPDYVLGNARVTWKNRKEDLAISFEVQNVFDKYYLLPLRFSALYSIAGTAYANVGAPREWALRVKKNF